MVAGDGFEPSTFGLWEQRNKPTSFYLIFLNSSVDLLKTNIRKNQIFTNLPLFTLTFIKSVGYSVGYRVFRVS